MVRRAARPVLKALLLGAWQVARAQPHHGFPPGSVLGDNIRDDKGRVPGGIEGHAFTCTHCEQGEAFGSLLRDHEAPEQSTRASAGAGGPWVSEVHSLWSTHMEAVPLTSDVGGLEPPSFHRRIAAEAINGWRAFRHKIAPGLPDGHPLKRHLSERHAGALNDAFFHWQKNLFEQHGNFWRSVELRDPDPNNLQKSNTTWPEMEALPEYQRLRTYVNKLSRRYLVRSGIDPKIAYGLNYSLFNWAAVHGPGEFHGPHTHVGEYHVAVFYAAVGPGSGKLRFTDPRGHNPPFGRTMTVTPKSGTLYMFPSWLSHMATVSQASTDIDDSFEPKEPPYRVILSFNIGPFEGPLPCHLWWSDPTGDMRFMRRTVIDREGLGL